MCPTFQAGSFNQCTRARKTVSVKAFNSMEKWKLPNSTMRATLSNIEQ